MLGYPVNNVVSFSISRLIAHLQIPLYRNGYMLMFNAVVTSSLGLIYWMLAAHYYSPEVVGFNSALLSTMTLLSGVAQLSLNGVLVRFVPVAGRFTLRLVAYIYLLSILVATVASLLFGIVMSPWSPTLRFIGERPDFLIVFVCSNVSWCVFALQDSLLTGLRQTFWIVVENFTFAVLKIVLLVFFATSFQRFGLFASWTLPIIVSLLPLNILIIKRLIPEHVKTVGQDAISINVIQIVRYIAGNYPGWLFFLASTTLLPLIVADQLGSSANAYFYLPWTIASSLYLIALNMMTSLTVEASADQSRLSLYCYRSLVEALRLVIPLVGLFFLTATNILQVFGSRYASEGVWLMRLLTLAAIPNIVVVLYITYARVRNQIVTIILVQGALCFISLGLSLVLLHFVGIIGIGLAWLAAQTSVATIIFLAQLRHVLRSGYAIARQQLEYTK